MGTLSHMSEDRQFDEADERAAANLRRLWREAQARAAAAGRPLKQKDAAGALGWSPSMVSHYLQGFSALGPVAVLKWAAYLGCKPTDIRPDFKFASIVASELSPEATELAARWEALPDRIRDSISDLILANSGE